MLPLWSAVVMYSLCRSLCRCARASHALETNVYVAHLNFGHVMYEAVSVKCWPLFIIVSLLPMIFAVRRVNALSTPPPPLSLWGSWLVSRDLPIFIYDLTSNSPFPSCCMPQFQSESWCTTKSNGNELHILMQIKLISLTIVEHQDSLGNRDKQQLRNGPFAR